MGKRPFVIVLDIDGTMLNNVTNIVNYVDMYNLAKQLAASKSIKCVMPPLDLAPFFKENAIVRPGLREFLLSLPPNTELFAYTCGAKLWASMLLPQLERFLGVRFNRPIFSREESCMEHSFAPPNTYLKSLTMIMPDIIKSLSSRYSGLNESVLRDRMIFIDDLKDNTIELSKRQIVCPAPLDFNKPRQLLDITMGFPKEALDHPAVAKMHVNSTILFYWNNKDTCIIDPISGPDGKLIGHMIKLPEYKDEDTFWFAFQKELKRAMGSKGTVSDRQISAMNKKLGKKN